MSLLDSGNGHICLNLLLKWLLIFVQIQFKQFTEGVLRRKQINQMETFLLNGTDYKLNIQIPSH